MGGGTGTGENIKVFYDDQIKLASEMNDDTHYFVIHPNFADEPNDILRHSNGRVKGAKGIIERVQSSIKDNSNLWNSGTIPVIEDASWYWERGEGTNPYETLWGRRVA